MQTIDGGILENSEMRACTLDDVYAVIAKYREVNGFYKRDIGDDRGNVIAFFRGQSDSRWKIEASINRSKVKEQFLLSNYKWDKEMPLFDIVSHIQHYCTGTRFIDFTVNPDVALYFACSQNPEKDGSFYIWCYSPDRPVWYRTIVLNELLYIENDEAISIQEFAEIILKKHSSIRERFKKVSELNLAIMSFLDHGFMVLPDTNNYEKNLRLKRQEGCFFICGVEFKNQIFSRNRWESNAGNNWFYPHSAIVPEELKEQGRFLKKIIIPSECKKRILEELQKKGITEAYLFPNEEGK